MANSESGQPVESKKPPEIVESGYRNVMRPAWGQESCKPELA